MQFTADEQPRSGRSRSSPEEVDRLRSENEALRERIDRLSEANARISQDLAYEGVVQGIVDGARLLIGARYGAMLVFDDAGVVREFITSGVTREERRLVGAPPEGLGLLGHAAESRVPLRLRDVADHPRFFGFPEGHPPMTTFLGVSLLHRNERFGCLYLTEKLDGEDFSPEDEEVLAMFASQAATTIAHTLRYRSEQEARRRLEALIDTSPVGVLVFDAKTRDLLSFNREVRRIVRGLSVPGGRLADLLGAMTFRRPDGSDIPFEELPTERVLRTGETVRSDEIIIHLPDDRRVTTLCNATPIRSEDGEIVSVVATLQDMTPLEEIERQRAEFLGMVSQALRRPLTSIKGSAATLLDPSYEPDKAERRQFYRIIEENTSLMMTLIKDLLDLARIEVGTLSVNPEPTVVADMVDAATETFLGAGARNHIEIDLAPKLPRIMADRRRIGQVLHILLSHASKHSSEKSTIKIGASLSDFRVAVSVAHEGRGYPAEELRHLFKKFSRTDGEEGQRSTRNEGLRLAICRGIVVAHGGRIWAESDGPGLGARFIFTVPAAHRETDGRRPGPSEGIAGGGQPILVVVEDRHTRWILHKTLSEAGYIPVETRDPGEVDHLIEANRPRLILLDLGQSGTDRLESMRRIRHITDAPIISLSERGTDRDMARAFETGADDHIVKPFSPTELLARIKATLLRQAASGTTIPRREPYVLGDLTIDYAERRVTVAGRPTPLTPTEYRLLVQLSASTGRVLTHDHLLRRVWGPEHSGDPRLVRTAIKSLRRKLVDDARNPTYIFTVPGFGYRMAKPEDG